jgi:3-deoxy-manno-octulosonate cytidylyltransferase (CMP-KDO synthetase)
MIQWVYEGVKQARLVDRIIIATDDERILRAASEFGAEGMMTLGAHQSGTERAAEVIQDIDNNIIINVQVDEPLVTGELVDKLVEILQDDSVPMASLMAKVNELNLIHEPHMVKVVTDAEGFALYFSRSPLPYQAPDFFYLHIGIYGYQRDFLIRFARMSPTRLERSEKLEQLRALENGYRVKMIEVPRPTLSVDTPRDIIGVEEFLRENRLG